MSAASAPYNLPMEPEPDSEASLLKSHPHLKDFHDFLEVLKKESDRGSVLIAATLIDTILLRTIAAFLLEHGDVRKLLVGFNAPLGTFSSKILATFALGLISEDEYRECEIIRRVRNAFAHAITTSFKDDRVKDLCSNLKFAVLKKEGFNEPEARGQFITAAAALALNLTNRPHYAGTRRIKFVPFPY